MASTITLTPVIDTYTAISYPSTNFSSSYMLKTAGVVTNNRWPEFISFFGFDLSTIPYNKIITNMTFSIYFIGPIMKNGESPPPSYTQEFNFVVRARRMTEYTIAELAYLDYNGVNQKTGLNHPYKTRSDPNDSVINIIHDEGSRVTFPIYDLTKSNECIIALFADDNFWNQFTYNFAASEYTALTPQLYVTIDDYVPPKPTNLSPNATTRNKSGQVNLSWTWEDLTMGTSQAAFEVQYSVNDFATYSTITGSTNNYCVIPANIFSDGQTVKWRVRVTDTNGDTSSYSDIASFVIGQTIPSTPEAINPINTIVNSSDNVMFRWNFKDSFGYTQAKYDLQIKKSSETETTISGTSANNNHVLNANTLSGGDYLWRVRCYNPFNEVSPYTEWQPFYSIGKPATPTVLSVTNNTRPVIRWVASEQDLFRIKIYKGQEIIYDSREKPGISINEYKVEEYLDNGNYTVGIMTSNIYGFWSNEAVYSFAVNTTKPQKPTIAGNVNGLYVAIIITSTTTVNEIYRKGEKEDKFKKLATLSGNTMTDYTCPAGATQYFVRSVSEDGYNDSDILSFNMRFNGIVLSGYDNQSDYINLYLTKDSDKRKSIVPTSQHFLVNCSGRKYPVKQSIAFKNHNENHEYFVRPEDFDKLYRILDYDTLIYRNNYGYIYTVSISNTIIQEDVLGYIVSFTLTRLEE